MMRFQYKKDYSFDQRKSEATQMRRKYSDRVPVILEKHPQSAILPCKYRKIMVPGDLTVQQFHHMMSKHLLQTNPSEGFWFFVKHDIPPSSVTMAWLYEEYHDEDFFLYVAYSSENVFGRRIM